MARTYRRDARGRFSSGGSGQTGGRGARLMSAGKTRSGGGAKVTTARVGGTISKPKGLNPQRGIAVRQAAAQTKGRDLVRKGVTEERLAKAARDSRHLDLKRYRNSPAGWLPAKAAQAQERKMARSARTSQRAQEFLRAHGTPMTFARRPKLQTADSPSFGTRKGNRRRR